ncbi:AaceriADR126Cp [[Ashbya] aceris (nom. inval.)]|nr:AaceriADR126Cp [[Ashbya] aceris (nom. inval.)]
MDSAQNNSRGLRKATDDGEVEAHGGWIKYVMPDFRAVFRSRGALEEYAFQEVALGGYELYVVEQWVYERQATTVVVTYTGNAQDVLHGVDLRVPTDEGTWPELLRQWRRQVAAYSTAQEPGEGRQVIITNISQVPSTLNLLHVEGGDLRSVWPRYQINFNLKRLGCAGRSALLCAEPLPASLDKFLQLYKIPMRDFEQAKRSVVQLVQLVQLILGYFGVLGREFQDGILCQRTEAALEEWWAVYGTTYLAVERPRKENALGPLSVSAVVSLLLACYFKLVVADVSSLKDPLDESSMFSAVYAFQRRYGLEKTACLDLRTVSKLFEVTSKTSNTDIFKFKRVVKSTVQDIAGKGNPIHLSSDILTTDLEKLVSRLRSGGSLRAFWSGKGLHQGTLWHDFTTASYEHVPTACEATVRETNTTQNDEMMHSDPDSPTDSNPYPPEISESPNAASTYTYHSAEVIDRALYRAELYRRSSSPDLGESQSSQQQFQLRLSRSASMSLVEDVFNVWSMPFEPALVRLARDTLKVQALAAQKQPYDEDLAVALEKRIGDLAAAVEVVRSKARDMRNEKDVLASKHGHLLKEMQELESLAAKFKYDVQVLDIRMRDIDEGISQFGLRLQKIEEQLSSRYSYHLAATEPLDTDEDLARAARMLLERQKPRYKSVVMAFVSWSAPLVSGDWNPLLRLLPRFKAN